MSNALHLYSENAGNLIEELRKGFGGTEEMTEKLKKSECKKCVWRAEYRCKQCINGNLLTLKRPGVHVDENGQIVPNKGETCNIINERKKELEALKK